MLIVIIFGLWVLSLIVANLNMHIALSDDEYKAYKSIDNLYTKSSQEEMHCYLKYVILRNKIKKLSSKENIINQKQSKFSSIGLKKGNKDELLSGLLQKFNYYKSNYEKYFKINNSTRETFEAKIIHIKEEGMCKNVIEDLMKQLNKKTSQVTGKVKLYYIILIDIK
jgi:hypothetical protein